MAVRHCSPRMAAVGRVWAGGSGARRTAPALAGGLADKLLIPGTLLRPCRFPGAQQDYIICGSDAGRIVILQFSKEKNQFVKVHQETFGKSGVR